MTSLVNHPARSSGNDSAARGLAAGYSVRVLAGEVLVKTRFGLPPKKFDKNIDRQEAFVSELRDFEDRLRWAANLNLDPDLNNGVDLNIAPIRELVAGRKPEPTGTT